LKDAFRDLLDMEEEIYVIGMKLEKASEEETARLLRKMGALQEMLDKSEFYSMESRIDNVANGLGLGSLGLDTAVDKLSGGQRTKVMLGRLLLEKPGTLILDEPTRGIDVGTKSEIQKLVVNLAEQGKAIVFISSEIEEMLRTCNRMVVMRDSTKVGELSDTDITQENIMKSIAGGTGI
jgi:simple sugar transport system ATP-binding protein